MGGTAKDYGQIMKLLLNDTELKNLMLISLVDQTNYTKMTTDYFVGTYTSDTLTVDGVCRLLIRSAPQNSTNNMFVKENNLLIEIYVPTSKDRLAGFERRINQISDRLIVLFHRKLVNDRRFHLEASNELQSSMTGYRRAYVQFSYKRIYT